LRSGFGALVLLLAGLAAASAQEPGPPLPAPQAPEPTPTPAPEPSSEVFSGEVERVVVDVVVVDRDGEPVADLTREDFVLKDEGEVQEILSFDVISPPPVGEAVTAERPLPRVVSNQVEDAVDHGRLFLIVFDDVHMTPLNAHRAKQAVAAFLQQGVRRGDRVTLVATGGDAWWSARIPEGRADLIEVLSHLEGRRIPDNAFERVTDYEAIRIHVYHDAQVAERVLQRFERFDSHSRRQFYDDRQGSVDQIYVPGSVDPFVENRAAQAYLRLRARLEVTLNLLSRTLSSLEETSDRKSVLLIGEGFASDPTNDAFRRVQNAARRANAALYFIDTKGLEALSGIYSAEFGAGPPERDLLSAIADVSNEAEGSVGLALDTGGFAVRDTNDLESGITRIGRESRTYYLLGYSPGRIERNGKFRKIDVAVNREDVRVRARRGYYAPFPEGREPASYAPETDPTMQRALDAPGSVEGLPLRATAYALDDTGAGKVRVFLMAEVDVSGAAFPEVEGRGLASLDTLVVATSRETGEFHRNDQAVELERRSAVQPNGPAWYTFLREFDMSPGRYQSKVVVRDANTEEVGSVLLEFDVPALDALRVTTPIVSNRLQPGPGGLASPALTVVRSFRPGEALYCRFEVSGAVRGEDGLPKVSAGHALRTAGGALLGRVAETLIEPTSLGALVRLIQVPLAGLAPGEYELLLDVKDELSGESRRLIEPFEVLPAPAS
jgi:VWFA-related protein